MTGGGGLHLPTEHHRGAVGSIVACRFGDLLQRVWMLLDGGDESGARQLHQRLLPGIVLEHSLGLGFSKEILVRRGVLSRTATRRSAQPLDDAERYEIDRFWEQIADLL